VKNRFRKKIAVLPLWRRIGGVVLGAPDMTNRD
jgi:hypothetical protein